ncbi:Ig-like domain-containing protein [Shewanella surugensis]|uniref:Ig-like domain-containing protein n=1 Tax=Shewanella surugensis TaxID=212020 RepID=A0ABT0LHV6_9GAMM|nr:Ig-like domain-containing protein [Shewanella surugensis]MCL1127274.1 Ig-like domain-containing protein [Shewanella surugensis]
MNAILGCCRLLCAGIFIVLFLVGCGGSETATFESPSVIALQVEPTSAVIPEETTQAYTATAIYNDNTTLDVTEQTTWSTSDPSSASISSSGVATGINSDDETEKVSALFQDQTTNVALMVSPAVPTGLVVTPTSLSLPQGSITLLTATVTYSDGTTFDASNSDNIAWEVSNSALLSVDNQGLLTANTQMNGSASVTATFSVNDNVVSGQSQLTVTDAIPIELVITPKSISIPQGTEQVFVAMATYSDGTQINVSTSNRMLWQSSNVDIATIESNGLATASYENNGNVDLKVLTPALECR